MDSGSGASIIARIRTTEKTACRNPNYPDSRTLTSPDSAFPQMPGFRAPNSVCFLNSFTYLCIAIAIAKHILPLPCDSSPFGHT